MTNTADNKPVAFTGDINVLLEIVEHCARLGAAERSNMLIVCAQVSDGNVDSGSIAAIADSERTLQFLGYLACQVHMPGVANDAKEVLQAVNVQ